MTTSPKCTYGSCRRVARTTNPRNGGLVCAQCADEIARSTIRGVVGYWQVDQFVWALGRMLMKANLDISTKDKPQEGK